MRSATADAPERPRRRPSSWVPDGVKDSAGGRSVTGAVPVEADMIDMVVPDVAAAQAWYEKYFGAKMVKRGSEMMADLPGENILFTQAKGAVAPTKGRAFDRIGIEVKNLEDTCKAVGASAVNQAKQFDLGVCTLTHLGNVHRNEPRARRREISSPELRLNRAGCGRTTKVRAVAQPG